ncbi:hypothetical protein LCGC14_0653760 [marine sediment metagenome]|uniref:Uncharacterized protein n=1 Tax=marine sediment metagenome TaxID=412755 RepID=A0A0F9THA0_9ZZZZ
MVLVLNDCESRVSRRRTLRVGIADTDDYYTPPSVVACSRVTNARIVR